MVMPAETPAWLRSALESLARAQERSEERFGAVETQLDRLAAAQERTEQRFAGVDERLDRLVVAHQELTEKVSRLVDAQEQAEKRLA
jgi:chromosome segregation ATPase